MTNVGAWHIRHNYGTNLWVDSLELVKHSTRVTSSRLSSEVRRCNSTSGLCSKLHHTVHCSSCLGKVNAVSRSPSPLLWRALATVKSLGWWRLRAARCSGFWVMVAEKRSFWRGEVGAATETGEGEALNCLVIYRFRKIILYSGKLSRENTIMNFTVWEPHTMKFWAIPTYTHFFHWEMLPFYHASTKVFSLENSLL